VYLKYYEAGYVPIPIVPNSKKPAIKGWNEWADNGIPRSEVEKFEEKFPIAKGYGIGIVCGRASNLVVLDIDTNDPTILQSCPASPVRRRGKTGEARFFQFNPELCNRSFTAKNKDGVKVGGIDILVDRKYIIVPPSIHPDTGKPFFWLSSEDLFDLSAGELPHFTAENTDHCGQLMGHDNVTEFGNVELKGNYESPDNKRSPHGSYLRLKALACGLVAECSTIDVAVAKLLGYDGSHHGSIGYFTDARSHADFGADPFSNAARFYANILKSVNQTRIRKGLQPQVPDSEPRVEIDISQLESALPVSKDFVRYPEPRGLMQEFVAYCELMGKGRQDALALGGGLALMGALCSNRFRSEIRGLWVSPNIYVLNLGHSGFGKDVSQRLLDDLLSDTTMVGSANYRSGSAIVQDLPKQQSRIDIIDECSLLLKAMNSDNVYQKEMVEILSLLFSRASSKFNGISSVNHGARHGAVWNPHLSILGSTTPAGFRESVNAAMASKGLMPRFITFYQKEVGRWKEKCDLGEARATRERLVQGVASVLSIDQRTHPQFSPKTNYLAGRQGAGHKDLDQGVRYDPIMVPFSAEAEALYLDYEKQIHTRSAKDPEAFESPFYGRFAELAAKVALLDAISLGRNTIEADGFEWSRDLLAVCWKNVKALYEFTSAENKLEQHHLRMVRLISDAGKPVSKAYITRRTQFMTRKLRDEVLANLSESGKIKVFEVTNARQRATTYYATSRQFSQFKTQFKTQFKEPKDG